MGRVKRWIRSSAIVAAVLAVSTFSTLPAESDDGQQRGCACVHRVGNVDCDYTDAVTLADLNYLIDHLFISMRPVPNPQEANCDADALCEITMGDLTALLDHLFISLRPLPWCPQILNHPPLTTLDAPPASAFIDGPLSSLNSERVHMHWSGTDRIDNPYHSQVEAFRWKLLGPYDDTTYEQLLSEFTVRVFQTPEGTVYRYGQSNPAFFCVCDTSYVNGQQVIFCDTIFVDTISAPSSYGVIDSLLDVESPEFLTRPELLRIVDSSHEGSSPWSGATSDTFYDVCANYPSDTTSLRHFIFWVTSRDLDDDAVEDPTPAWCGFEVFEPRHEHPVLVINCQKGALTNGPSRAVVKDYWCQAVASWLAGRPDISGTFDSTRDYCVLSNFVVTADTLDMLHLCMRHRLLILASDDVMPGGWARQNYWYIQEIYSALRSGTQAWVAMRTPLGDYASGSEGDTLDTSPPYAHIWGVERIRFSAWYHAARYDSARIEDFVGAQPVNAAAWPVLAVDSALLHQRYLWSSYIPWNSSLAALPEVDYCVPTPDAEVLYSYISLYGNQHPMGAEYSFEGLPVMVRVDLGTLRTAHSLFTPLALGAAEAQTLVNAALDWLQEACLSSPSDRKGD